MHRRLRVTLLALSVVLSAVAIPVGTLAAPTTADTAPANNTDEITTQAQADTQLQSGERFWQGWELSLDASRVVEGGALELWRVTEDGQLNQQVDTVSVAADGSAVVDTRGLDGRYVLRHGDQAVYVHQGQAYLSSPPDGTNVTVETAAFRIQRQTLTLEWTDPEVFPGQSTALAPASNRDRTVAALSVGGLSFEQLTAIVPRSAYAANHDARASSNELLVVLQPGETIRLNTWGRSPGSYQFNAQAVDTTARARATLTVKTPSSDRRILSVERRENVGDVLVVELACNSCHFVVGTPEQGTIDILELQDGNGDGRVILRINTRYAGMYTGASGYPSNRRQYTSPSDDIRRYSSGTTLEQIEEELSYAVNTAGKLRDRLGLAATGRVRPIQPGRLQLTVASTDFIMPRSGWGDRAPYGSQLVIRDETDAKTVELTARSLDGVAALAAPGGDGFDPTVSSLRATAAPRQQLALGDRLVFRVDVSGLFGFLDAAGATVESLHRNEDEGIDLAIHRLAEGSDERLPLDRVDVQFLVDPSNDALYVVFGTGSDRPSYLQAGRYRLTLTLEGVPSQYEEYSTQNGFEGYPYLEPGATETASATVALEPAVADITAPAPDSTPRLSADGTLQFQGTTSMAAGTDLEVHVDAVEFAWQTRASTTVGANGRWSATLDLSEAPGEQFAVTVSRNDEALVEETYTIQPPATTETASGDGGTPGNQGAGNGSSTPGSPEASNGGDGGDATTVTPSGEGGGSLIPGVSNVTLFGGIFFLLMVVFLVVRAVM